MALFNNTSFRILEQGLDAVWLKQQVVLQNIANADTPDYKAKTVNFKTVLKDQIKSRAGGGQTFAKQLNLETEVSIEKGTSQIFDGNNVDQEKEQMALLDAQIQYEALINKANSEFSMIRTAIAR